MEAEESNQIMVAMMFMFIVLLLVKEDVAVVLAWLLSF